MAQDNPLKNVSTFERMNSRFQLLCLNIMAHYFKEWTTVSGVLKKNEENMVNLKECMAAAALL